MIPPIISDNDLFAQIKQGDTFSFELLFERYWDKLFKIAYARLNDEDDAKDLVQELLINFWNKKEQIEITTSLEKYLFGALKLSIISYFRSLKVTETRLMEASQRLTILENAVTDMEDYLHLEKVLEQAVDLMPETLQKIYALRSDNVPIKHIALQLGLADQTVKNYISELLKRLKKNLTDKFPEKHLTYLAIFIYALNN